MKGWDELLGLLDTTRQPLLVLFAFQREISNDLAKIYKLRNSNDKNDELDYTLTLRADSLKKEILELDSYENLIKLQESTSNPKNYARNIVFLIRNIQNGNFKKLRNENSKALREFQDYKKGLANLNLNKNAPKQKMDQFDILARNKKWMKKLPKLLKEKNCFIIVGLGHISYREGLISQLRKSGFTLTPIKITTNS